MVFFFSFNYVPLNTYNMIINYQKVKRHKKLKKKKEYQSGLPLPSSGYLAVPEIKLISPALAGGFFTTEPLGSPLGICYI